MMTSKAVASKLEIGPSTRVSVAPDVHARKIEDQWVLLDLRAGSYFGLDDVGGAVWECLCQGKTLDQVADALLARFEVDRGQLLSDVVTFVLDLVDRGICSPSECGVD